MVRFIGGLLTLLFSISSFALVDMRNANYSDSWIDLQVKGSAFDLRVQRTYNSRTLFNGMFGFGWCSEFETGMVVTATNTLRVTECGAGSEIEYIPGGYKKDTLDSLVKSILAEVKKRNSGRDKQFFERLESDLRRDGPLRDEFAKQLNLTGKVSEGQRYVANARSSDYITFDGSVYTRVLPNGSIQKFDKQGRMTQMGDRNGNFLKMIYREGKVSSITDNSGASLQFKYYPNSKFAKEIVGPSGLKASYKFTGETLVSMTNAWGNSFKYEYDELYNLTKAVYPDKTFFALTYDKDKDWVTSFTDRKGCKEKYTYADNVNDPLNNYKSGVEKVCDGQVTNKSDYEFWHKQRKDGTRYLARARSVVNGKTIDTTYHEVFGRPVEIRENDIVTKFAYYDNGLLKSKSDPYRTFAYKYENPCGKVSEVALTVFGATRSTAKEDSGKNKMVNSTAKQTTRFLYDSGRCNLVTAKNSSGQIVDLSYDVRGRITKILDQTKKEVLISYEERFGKPAVVSRPGLGTIKFKYKSDGSVDKFDSPDDPLVAVQVANIFSNLLEIIAPATTDVNNI